MNKPTEHVILVDEQDRETGTMEKMEAHEKGLLHRAFSIFLFNENGEMLLQKRASKKYHTGGLWTNTCCSHPRENESMDEALQRRLMQEMGIQCPVNKAFTMLYKSSLANGLTEHEFDHVYYGYFSEEPKPNPEEVEDWKYISLGELKADVEKNPENYTPWFVKLYSQMDKYSKPVAKK